MLSPRGRDPHGIDQEGTTKLAAPPCTRCSSAVTFPVRRIYTKFLVGEARSHVKDSSTKGELVPRHAHRLFHAEHLGVVQSRLVEILKRLRDEEQRKEKHVNPLSDSFVLLWGLKRSATAFTVLYHSEAS